MTRIKAFSALALLALLGGIAVAQTPSEGVKYQVVVADKDGKPAAAGCGPVVTVVPCPQACPSDCRSGCDCDVTWLRCWTCEDLEMKPVEPTCNHCGCGWLHGLLWCPPAEEKNGNHKNHNGEKKNGNGEKKNGEAKEGEKKNGNGEEAEEPEEPEVKTPLMQLIECYHPSLAAHLDCSGTKVYGWVQGGYTYNFDGPNRAPGSSFLGPQFNNRHNDIMLNQLWLRLENTLEHEKEANIGYIVDVNFGQDAADFNVISIGMWENFTGDADVAIADDEDYGLDLPQFMVMAHIPGFITEKGMDVHIGRMLTLHGNELSPAYQTRFYSHSYGYFYSWPLTHTGVMTNLHLTDTLDMWNCVVLGWDNVFADNNDKLSYHGMLIWTACDKRSSAWVATTIGPEGIGRFDSDNESYRVLVTYDYSRKFGCYNEWELVLHGANAWDENLFTKDDVEWYDYAVNLFYTVDPRLILGVRGEYFRDDDGYRIGFADSFYEVTAGLTYKPYQNLRVRPEFRVDWADDSAAFNDFSDKEMYTIAVDFIWEF